MMEKLDAVPKQKLRIEILDKGEHSSPDLECKSFYNSEPTGERRSDKQLEVQS